MGLPNENLQFGGTEANKPANVKDIEDLGEKVTKELQNLNGVVEKGATETTDTINKLTGKTGDLTTMVETMGQGLETKQDKMGRKLEENEKKTDKLLEGQNDVKQLTGDVKKYLVNTLPGKLEDNEQKTDTLLQGQNDVKQLTNNVKEYMENTLPGKLEEVTKEDMTSLKNKVEENAEFMKGELLRELDDKIFNSALGMDANADTKHDRTRRDVIQNLRGKMEEVETNLRDMFTQAQQAQQPQQVMPASDKYLIQSRWFLYCGSSVLAPMLDTVVASFSDVFPSLKDCVGKNLWAGTALDCHVAFASSISSIFDILGGTVQIFKMCGLQPKDCSDTFKFKFWEEASLVGDLFKLGLSAKIDGHTLAETCVRREGGGAQMPNPGPSFFLASKVAALPGAAVDALESRDDYNRQRELGQEPSGYASCGSIAGLLGLVVELSNAMVAWHIHNNEGGWELACANTVIQIVTDFISLISDICSLKSCLEEAKTAGVAQDGTGENLVVGLAQ